MTTDLSVSEQSERTFVDSLPSAKGTASARAEARKVTA